MDGNMCWNMVAMSLTCMPSEPKLLRTRRGWCVNCWSCIRCFFRDDTTSLMREYCEKSSHKDTEKGQEMIQDGSLGTSMNLLWKHYHQSNVNILSSEPTIFVFPLNMHLPSALWSEALGLWEVVQPSKSTWKGLANSQLTGWHVRYQPGLTIFTLLGVLLKIMKCVTPKGPATDTKSFSTFFFLTWHIATGRYRYGEYGRGKNRN